MTSERIIPLHSLRVMTRTINETPLFNDVSRCRESQHYEGLAAKAYMCFLDLRFTALRNCKRSNVDSVPLEPDQADNARSQSRTHKMVMRSIGSSLGAGSRRLRSLSLSSVEPPPPRRPGVCITGAGIAGNVPADRLAPALLTMPSCGVF